MDELVLQALRKWPNVPACFGWLALDARGQWRMRDAATQAAGLPGDVIRHEALNGFINRNYAQELMGPYAGAWFFQNGPQKVYVDLAYAPWVLRWHAASATPLTTHTGLPASAQAAWLDEAGNLLLQTEHGVGLLHDLDLVMLADCLVPVETDAQATPEAKSEQAVWQLQLPEQTLTVQTLQRTVAAAQFGWINQPR